MSRPHLAGIRLAGEVAAEPPMTAPETVQRDQFQGCGDKPNPFENDEGYEADNQGGQGSQTGAYQVQESVRERHPDSAHGVEAVVLGTLLEAVAMVERRPMTWPFWTLRPPVAGMPRRGAPR